MLLKLSLTRRKFIWFGKKIINSKAGNKANKSKQKPCKLKCQGFYAFWKNRL